MKPIVYFTRDIKPEKVIELYELVGRKLNGKVAVKLHSGETGNQNFIRPDFWKPMVNKVGGTVVECNTAYEGTRNTTKAHWKTMEEHGWTKNFNVDIMDEDGEIALDIPNGKHLKQNFVGKNMQNYDSMLVLTHFKGHPMGGFGGSLKTISIGIASSHGKAHIHGAGKPEEIWSADHNSFLESMADACASIANYWKENIVYINVMKNMSVDCDCCSEAEDPKMADIGILASTEPVALDQACIDLVYTSPDAGKSHLIERIESRNGLLILDAAEKLGIGSRKYELKEI